MGQRSLLNQTKQMKDYLIRIGRIYEEVREKGEREDFFTKVKPFAEEVERVAESWCVEAKKWVEINRPKGLRPLQLEAAKEHLKEISIQAFFPETSYKRFKHYIHSIHYTLEKLIGELEK